MTHCGESSAGLARGNPLRAGLRRTRTPCSPQSLPCLPGLLLNSSHPTPSPTRQTRRQDRTTKRLPEHSSAAPPGPEPSGRGGQVDTPQPFLDPQRPGGSFRQPPPRYGPPPGAPRDTGPLPAAYRPDNTSWSQPAGLAATAATAAARIGRSNAASFRHTCGSILARQRRRAGGPRRAASADGVLRRPDPGRRPGSGAPRPTGSWLAVRSYKATFGLVNLGPSPDEIHQAELVAKIKSVLRGHYKVGVMGKGGVGKTTVSASIGSVFAELRQDDRVVAIDADTAFGKLGSRVDPKAQGSYWELASDQHLETFADLRGRVGNNAAGLFVLAGEATPARRRVLDPAIYREATSRLDRYFTISIIDCSSTMDTPVTQEVLRDLDALVVVSSPWVDGAAAAGQTLDWLANRGLTNLLQRTVIVLNDSDGHADKRTRSILAQQFSSQGQTVIEVPFDGHLRPGGVIDRTSEMSAATRRRFIDIAAALRLSTSRRATIAAESGTHGFDRRQAICLINASIS